MTKSKSQPQHRVLSAFSMTRPCKSLVSVQLKPHHTAVVRHLLLNTQRAVPNVSLNTILHHEGPGTQPSGTQRPNRSRSASSRHWRSTSPKSFCSRAGHDRMRNAGSVTQAYPDSTGCFRGRTFAPLARALGILWHRDRLVDGSAKRSTL